MAKKKPRKVGRPPAHPEGKTELIAVRVPLQLLAKLDVYAQRNDLNQSEAVTEAIRQLAGKVRVPRKKD